MSRSPELNAFDGGLLDSPPPAAGAKSPSELGDILARFIWESFSDSLEDPQFHYLLSELGHPTEEAIPEQIVVEETLILHMWAHSQAVQISFRNRVPDAKIRETLDHVHRAVFEDMVSNGTPTAQLPVFEQRVSARYAEYYEASSKPDNRIGETAVANLAVEAGSGLSPALARIVTDHIMSVAKPLRDYLSEVELTD